MKRTLLIFIAVFFAGCAKAQQPAQATTQTVYSYGMPQHRLAVQNVAPWTCRLVTVAPIGRWGRSGRMATIVDLAPGETVFAGEAKKKGVEKFNIFSKSPLVGYARSSNLDIPLICVYVAGDQYIGAAAGIFYIPGAGNSSVSQLVFGQQNIRFADDTMTNAPKAESRPIETPVDIPYFGTEGTAIQIFVWNSSVPARITVNGGGGDDLRLGDIKAFVGWSPIIVSVTATDADGRIRTWNRGFQNSDYYGTHAQVFILGMSDLR